MAEITLIANKQNLSTAIGFVKKNLEQVNCSKKVMRQVTVAAEEIFVNIASYAYEPKEGSVTIRFEIGEAPPRVSIVFIDGGIQYDPLAREKPDVSLKAKERKVGGLGIFMTKQLMDDIKYQYSEGKNILEISKLL